ncbi:hypothetical protein ACGFIF_06050 [Kribbella sp. NPDC049174]|uniref:hypothetical protein n=1 Tax=Kribbella sp. NPDC049174 TaxID=3364112 RepID=UPI0037155552
MSTADWTMGSTTARQTAVEPGRTLIGEVVSNGALMYAPRTLRLLVGADATCVRSPDGRLIWLETTDSSAFTAADGQVHKYTHTDEATVLVPRDTAAEARALVNLPAALAWSTATLQPGSQPADPQQFEHRPADIQTAAAADGRQLRLAVDRETGVILAITGKSLRGDFDLKLRSVHMVNTTPDHFAARHL